ncbi:MULTISPECIES: hypothetical protein [unclassified Streptomyces]|uniref:hypothetical protein n=1 Tax=unclassified Streptomyces TaxID=2593676 RepID=UPI002E1BBED2
MLSPVEPLALRRRVDLPVLVRLVDLDVLRVDFLWAVDGDAVVVPGLLTRPVLEFLDRQRGVVGNAVYGHAPLADTAFGDIEVVSALVLVVLEALQ